MDESMEKRRPNYYPQVEVVESNPNPLYSERQPSAPPMYPPSPQISNPSSSSSSSSLYPTIDMDDLLVNLFPDHPSQVPPPTAPPIPIESVEDILLTIPGAILHLIDKQYSVELASGNLSIVSLRQGNNIIAVFARIADEIEWPLFKDTPSVKLDHSHYFFSLRFPKQKITSSSDEDDEEDNGKHNTQEFLNYGVTIASKGQEKLLKELDQVLGLYTAFSVEKVSAKNSEALDGKLAKEVSPSEMKSVEKKEIMEEKSAAYWTTLAPNVEDYSGSVAKGIALGSGRLIQGILWCGDVTVDRLKWGDEFLRKRMDPCQKDTEVSPETLKRIKRVKKMTKMSQKVATGVLSGVVKVSGYVTSSVVNSKAGKKFFNLLPGEIVLATLDGFGKVCDAVEVAGKNVMSTTSTVTTGLVSHRHGEKAAAATHEGMDAAGHAMGTAWAVFKIRQALNPKSAIKPTSLGKAAAKAAAAEVKKKNKKK